MKRAVAIVIIVAAVVLAAVAWLVTLRCQPATGPRRMTWRKADGALLVKRTDVAYPFDGCDGDIGMNLAVWNGGMIVSCDHEELGVGWAFLDPRTGEARLRWPVPPGGMLARTVGVIPGPDHQLAIVYEAKLESDLLAGVARADGWASPPINLGRRRYHAAAWVGGKLELATRPTSDADPFGFQAPIEIITLDGAAYTSRVALPACDSPCITPEIGYRAGGRWVFEIDGHALGEGGQPTTAVLDTPSSEGMVDLVAHGRLDTPAALSLGEDTPGIGPDGKVTHPAGPPRPGLRPIRQDRFTIDGAIRRRPQWRIGRSNRWLFEQVGDRTIAWHTGEDDRVWVTDEPVSEDGMPAVAAVARWSLGLAHRVILTDDAGGFWMIDGSGEYLHLDAALHRTDPLSLRMHLAQRGSLGTHIDEPEHEQALGWALFGLPLLVAGVALAAWLAKATPGRVVVVAAVLYLATGGWALLHVLPLLV
ncbi:MAG TPA: hypothetical protein VH165_16945 [Kofleriaceae bacterium]|nr:hypothetical protein [Kofleriaceae bacterium]